jgi:hypothetical protein
MWQGRAGDFSPYTNYPGVKFDFRQQNGYAREKMKQFSPFCIAFY